MSWNKSYLDAILVPIGFGFLLSYHVYHHVQIKINPLQTIIGINNLGKRAWVRCIMQNNDQRNVLAVQTLRNSIMGSTLMATAAILLSTGLAAFLSTTTESINATVQTSIYGDKGSILVPLKFLSILFCFLFSFICYMQSIRFINYVNYLINVPLLDSTTKWSPEFVGDVLVRGGTYHSIGTRSFYTAFALMLWIFGPIPAAITAVALIPFFYHLDFVKVKPSRRKDIDDLEASCKTLTRN
ncbi:hypothetical protein O6H91_22G044000 [Diphasiastrum complanatum]|uniref:Uncharacterized protein n=2 Tax=Diphasiastrum complanatum TaxID=34168 RepID=A0ACC2AEW2_DIPCM|nr:hypothetical protein O6H91_22G043700 [Diphasiastrum complanatum]KAJ7516127.1 hypothetical protein O6H91_22G044000 [Diphasiastrum complanatum]